ncbi:hypothetical protein [Riemerella anatipestifer]|uniref:hypothetical protein n=1 Tax=Riemerella anatipestifer TaxID=34085 RepID=UPI0001F0E470|nr:hypothetical protein [Riemerella anatipestifer]ADZ11539.1 hypothetical protein RIA_0360 [Riemerella anatipestifer RA-GD]EFT36513.1 hypothetical protein RAYM_08240 [Riemerella anatipestifer RA-YM]MBT0564756.1 hypothetical protein [Riemerella anatipestifer]MCT6746068.1 hypothetical protein [Riemerella anatipestifer]MCU7573619.1 hypothetical protein [Riemerella anatipestifer]
MGEVREATSPSGGVSRRADVAKGAKRISPHRLANWRWSRLLAQMLNRITNLQHCTKVQ